MKTPEMRAMARQLIRDALAEKGLTPSDTKVGEARATVGALLVFGSNCQAGPGPSPAHNSNNGRSSR